ncbi:kelch repeat protein [Anaeramoeba ignava]|uniref:Kelch repeat protein n=1 Tax=Anaeramoeba ignava TaxID=1746090 RepID=A0A9Q0R8L2_ANAIG|nr:kelch repeat protein [Anaeramoeba ignava]
MSTISFLHSVAGWRKDHLEGEGPETLHKPGIAVIGDECYVFGGGKTFTCSSTLYCASIFTHKWSTIETSGDIPKARLALGMCGFEDKLWITCGFDYSTYFQDTFEFDLTTEKWTQIHSEKHPQARYSFSLLYHNSFMYLFGGVPQFQKRLNDTWQFNTIKKHWEKIEPFGKLPVGRSSHTAIIHNNSMVIFGGLSSNGSRVNDLQMLDLTLLTWFEIETKPAISVIPNLQMSNSESKSKSKSMSMSMLKRRFKRTQFWNSHSPPLMSGGVAMIYLDRYLVSFGGMSTELGEHNYTFVFDFETKEWSNYDKTKRDHLLLEEFLSSQQNTEKKGEISYQINPNLLSELEMKIEDKWNKVMRPPPSFGHVGFARNRNELFVFGGFQKENDEIWIFTLENEIVMDFRLFLESGSLCDF